VFVVFGFVLSSIQTFKVNGIIPVDFECYFSICGVVYSQKVLIESIKLIVKR